METDLQNPVIFNVFKNSLCPSKLLLCPSTLEVHKSSLGGTTKKIFRRFMPEFCAPHFEIPSGASSDSNVKLAKCDSVY